MKTTNIDLLARSCLLRMQSDICDICAIMGIETERRERNNGENTPPSRQACTSCQGAGKIGEGEMTNDLWLDIVSAMAILGMIALIVARWLR